MPIELKHLRALEAIQRTGTVSAAALELGYSQPAISQQVSQAERAVGTPLLNRTRAGVTLTEAGTVLVAAGRSAIETVSRAVSEVEAIVGLRSGIVRIATFPSAAAVILPGALGSVRAQHPDLGFAVSEREPPEALRMLRAGKCDIALVYGYSTVTATESHLTLLPQEVGFVIAKEPIKVALPPDHRFGAERVIDLRDLADETWIAGCSESQSHVLDLCQSVGFTPRIRFETQNHVAIHRLVNAGFGIALLPELVASAGTTGAPVRLVACSPSSFRTARAITTENLLAVPGVRVVIDGLRKQMHHLHQSGEPMGSR